MLVTGATGFIGRHVVAELRARGHEVRALARSRSAGAEDVLLADLRTADLRPAVEGVEAVVHLAARVEGSDDERFAGTVVTTERLLDAIAGSSVRRLVLASSYAVYDWSAATGALDESTPLAERPYGRDGYTVAKVWQERIVRRHAERSGLELVVLRPGFVWGPGATEVAGAGVPAGPIQAVVAPRMRLPLTYVENCADCFADAVERPEAAGRTVNVVDSDSVSAWRYAGHLAGTRRATRIPVPYALALALVRLIAAASARAFPSGGKLPSLFVPARFEARFKPLRHPNDEARRALGWTPRVGFEEALRRSFGE